MRMTLSTEADDGGGLAFDPVHIGTAP